MLCMHPYVCKYIFRNRLDFILGNLGVDPVPRACCVMHRVGVRDTNSSASCA